MVEEEREAAAALIAADPAFAALEASGAPIVAVRGEPTRIVYKNAAALAAIEGNVDATALLGKEGGVSELETLLQSARQGVAPRLERAPIQLSDGSLFVTILCRQIEQSPHDSFFVIAALGLRSQPAAGGSAQERSKASLAPRRPRASPSSSGTPWSPAAAIARPASYGKPTRRASSQKSRPCSQRSPVRICRALRAIGARGRARARAWPRFRRRARVPPLLERGEGRLADRDPPLQSAYLPWRHAGFRQGARLPRLSGIWRVAPRPGGGVGICARARISARGARACSRQCRGPAPPERAQPGRGRSADRRRTRRL